MFLVAFCLLSPVVEAKSDIIFLVDFSGSMRKVTGGQTQIDVARTALLQALEAIPEGSLVGVRTYGHRVAQNDKEGSCQDSQLIVPLDPVNTAHIFNKVRDLTPKGFTPLAYSLSQAKSDFSTEREAERVIILLSDGEETCGGDPVAVLNQFKESGFDVIVHTVGFNVDAKTRKQLESIAQAGQGHYYDAQGAAALTAALEEVTKESVQEAAPVVQEKATFAQPIRGGDSYATATPLQYDVEYKLNHHQKISYFDYFYVELQPGRELNIDLHTHTKGVNLRGEQPVETLRPYASLHFHGSQQNKIKTINILGESNGMTSYTYSAPEADRYYLLVGSTYDDMNKDHVTFRLSMTTRGDLDSNKDAGDGLTKAMAMETKRYTKNFIGSGDLKDVFSFEADENDIFFIGIIPNGESKSYFRIAIFDSYKQKIMSQSSGIGEGLKSKEFKIPETGTYYLQVDLGTTVDTPISYTLEVKNAAQASVDKEKAKSKKTSTPAKSKKRKKKSTKPSQPMEAKPEAPQEPRSDSGSLARPSVTKIPAEKPPIAPNGEKPQP